MDQYKFFDKIEKSNEFCIECIKQEEPEVDIPSLIEEILSLFSSGEISKCKNCLKIMIKHLYGTTKFDPVIFMSSHFIGFIKSVIFETKDSEMIVQFVYIINVLFKKYEDIRAEFNDRDFIGHVLEISNDTESIYQMYFPPILAIIYKRTEDNEVKEMISSNLSLNTCIKGAMKTSDNLLLCKYFSLAILIAKETENDAEIENLITLCDYFIKSEDIPDKHARQIGSILEELIPKENFPIFFFMDTDIIKKMKTFESIPVVAQFYTVYTKLLRFSDYLTLEYNRPAKDAIFAPKPQCVAAARFIYNYSLNKNVAKLLIDDNIIDLYLKKYTECSNDVRFYVCLTISNAIKAANLTQITSLMNNQELFQPLKFLIKTGIRYALISSISAIDHLFSSIELTGNDDLRAQIRIIYHTTFKGKFIRNTQGYDDEIDAMSQTFITTFFPYDDNESE